MYQCIVCCLSLNWYLLDSVQKWLRSIHRRTEKYLNNMVIIRVSVYYLVGCFVASVFPINLSLRKNLISFSKLFNLQFFVSKHNFQSNLTLSHNAPKNLPLIQIPSQHLQIYEVFARCLELLEKFEKLEKLALLKIPFVLQFILVP